MDARKLLAFLAIKYDGEYNRMVQAIKDKEHINEEELNRLLATNTASYITIIDKDYPEFFRNINRPPLVLFYYGDWKITANFNQCVAIVGSRHPDEYGLSITKTITTELVNNGITVVSGLAQGIDRQAHEAAIKNNGKTIAVLGSGIDNPYPKSNLDIYEIMKKDHLIVSEYPGKINPDATHFPMRNRLVAALARATLVTQAHERSGTLITVSYALTMGRDIYCVPYLAGHSSSCNRLIKEGAYLVESAKDVLDLLRLA
ncbi:MAG: DNA-processing protein DprA [Bacilli bacterium]|jgi:DNA processing protein|nr:DNA-processing protein DprA [Bacilli bacterium]MCH4236103.1 DNA-processing protein DprA [Bacilli bacterium]